MEEPLDFEQEDHLLSHAPRLPSKRKRAIGLDDLLSDFYERKRKTVEKCSRHFEATNGYDSDEDDKRFAQIETYFHKFVEVCEKQDNEIGSEDEYPIWGRRAFGMQKAFPQLEKPVTANSDFFGHFSGTGFASIFDSNGESVEIFLEGLLTNGWLSCLVATTGSLEDSIASWTFHTNGACEGPPLNICSWIRALSACCQIRNRYQIFSSTEMQELLEVVIWFYLDRHLLGLALELNGCFHSIVHYFLDAEWEDSCAKVAASIALRVPKDLNCLRIVECITGSDNRTKYLKSQLALHLLIVCFDNKAKSAEEILKLLASVNLEGNSCDFFKLYIYLVLTENHLLLYHPFQEKSKVVDLWCQYLRNCSTQITSTDWRTYPSKVRNKASYLLQNMALKSSS
ncbi:uncharacterized protein LOC144564416 [Carex rostrata]